MKETARFSYRVNVLVTIVDCLVLTSRVATATEVGFQGPCGGSGFEAGLRLFVSGGVKTDPNGTQVLFQFSPISGNFFLSLPSATELNGLPIQLPGDPYPVFVSFADGINQLQFRSAEIRVVPEPGTLLLMSIGVGLAALGRGALVTSKPSLRSCKLKFWPAFS